MNEEQLIATLQACYFGDKGAFNKILKEYKQLQQENQQLKEKDLIIAMELEKLQQENKQLQSTLAEIREYIEDSGYQMSEGVTYDLLQIIDKLKENK